MVAEESIYISQMGYCHHHYDSVLCSHIHFLELIMAKNPPTGDGHRVGAVKQRSQTQTPAGNYVKRDTGSGRFMDVKTSDKSPFKGVRREK